MRDGSSVRESILCERLAAEPDIENCMGGLDSSLKSTP